jgi:hypothetical protein
MFVRKIYIKRFLHTPKYAVSTSIQCSSQQQPIERPARGAALRTVSSHVLPMGAERVSYNCTPQMMVPPCHSHCLTIYYVVRQF